LNFVTLAVLVAVASAAFAPLHRASQDPIKGSYIVVFSSNSTTLEDDLAFIQQTHGVEYQHTYSLTIKGFAAKLSAVQLMNVRSHPNVAYVEEDGIARALQGTCSITTGADWGLTRVAKREIELNGDYFYPDHSAATIDSYIIDTGIYTQHTDFEGRAIQAFKSDNNWPSTDDNGHGTHVASTVGGAKYGVARKVQLIGVKVLNAGGSGSWAGVISGVEFSVSSKNSRGRPSTANMSLGGGKTVALDQAVNAASRSGVFVVAAAGNSNADACNFSPAGADDVISVIATDIGARDNDEQEDVRSYFSNFGTCTHVCAPGSDILGAWIGNPTATRILSGTSMASPHVCGVASLLLHENPSHDIDSLKAAVVGRATINKINFNCGGRAACDASPNLLLFNGCE
jgi:subtilisin family serine protease